MKNLINKFKQKDFKTLVKQFTIRNVFKYSIKALEIILLFDQFIRKVLEYISYLF